MKPPKKADWRHDPEILKRLPQVEDLHLMGYPNTRIAEAMHVTEGTIRLDLKRIAVLWHERAGDSIAAQKERSVAVYRRVQRAAWQEFQGVKDTSLNKSAYLNTIKASEDSIGKVLGTEAPVKVVGPDGESLVTFTLKLSNDGSIPVPKTSPLPETE